MFQDLIKNGHSIWSPACSFHGTTIYSKDYNSYILKTSENDLTSQDAVEAFVFQDKGIVNIDQYPWPSNRRCAFWFDFLELYFFCNIWSEFFKKSFRSDIALNI